MPNGLFVPNRKRNGQQRLPVELTQRNSDIDVMITIAGDSANKRTFGFESTVKTTRRLIKQGCPSFSPTRTLEFGVLCRSGEDGAEPFEGSNCFQCRAGQFSASGMFVGDEVGGYSKAPTETSVEAFAK